MAFPDTPASATAENDGRRRDWTLIAMYLLIALVWIGTVLCIGVSLVIDPPAEYSVAVSAAAAAADGGGVALAPSAPAVFSLTLHIRNPSKLHSECVTSNATASVSYNGTHQAAAAAVPPFCLPRKGKGEAVVPVAWGAGAPLPPPGAVVDVAVRIPDVYACRSGHGCAVKVACSGVRVGGGGLSICDR